mmetsp:Transcript_9623/g.14132  ORF Transcript_9623/g.14132 Transcript_9623/m.14132 type:complete len:431 (-) Transcript_9623:175-1467(-)
MKRTRGNDAIVVRSHGGFPHRRRLALVLALTMTTTLSSSAFALSPRKTTSRSVGATTSAYTSSSSSPKDLRMIATRSEPSSILNSKDLSRRSFLTAIVASASIALFATSTVKKNDDPTRIVPESSLRTTTSSNAWEETVSGFIAGGALTATKTVVKYPLDTATVRLQMPNTKYSLRRLNQLMEGSFRGIVTPLLWNVAGGAMFFAVKDATKEALLAMPSAVHLPHWSITFLAVAVAQCPYWLVRNPSEVVKTKQQAGVEGFSEELPMAEAFSVVRNESIKQNNGNPLLGFYTGYVANIIYGYPADVIKFVMYDCLVSILTQYLVMSPTEATLIAGATATAVSQLVTNPLDVVRNRVMAGEDTTTMTTNNDSTTKSISYLDRLVRLGREEGLNGLFLGATPSVGKALLSGAIQFATYEQTKQHIAMLFHQR